MQKEIKVGNLTIKNRLVMPPMATRKADELGIITDDVIDFYDQRTKNKKIGLVITEHAYVDFLGKASPNQIALDEACDIEKLKKLVDVIHQNDALAFCQISHAGGKAIKDVIHDIPFAPSAIILPNAKTQEIPREMSLEDIENVITKFTESAKRAHLAGFDGVEIHSAHGYLLNQFFSPLSNKRKDEFGGCIDKRIKIHLEIIKRIKALGNINLAVRIGACDYMECGTTIQDAIYACQQFEKAGVDLIDVSGGFCFYTNPYDESEGYFSKLSEEIKKHVSIPVILTGGIRTKKKIEELLENKKADMIGIGRPIFKSPNWYDEIL